MKRVWICINGINTFPGDSDGWTDRAVTWLHLHTNDRAEKWEYVAGALTRRFKQQHRADAIARMCDFYFKADFEISFIAHSNGADLVARVIDSFADQQRLFFNSAHLFAPAADPGPFLSALKKDRLGYCHIYGSPHDKALRLATVSRTLFGWAGLGYGSLGLNGPAFARWHDRARATEFPDFGHSDWFGRGRTFERTMRMVQQNEHVFFHTPRAGFSR